ncbi:hypothetical protein BABINDRAFT_163391 [Babjeviella inositovora NRRL Y-12698]|uniref:non-specific serine/threonine protein kinase n=1 Tax=Babjeviella inositovora NRRL Y-12698 TaxID=984486 RepID=A0A1E3QJ15_9ASCO|nr:uncharacterized protein BABINDRAFT_163391 [Babjeviella inositovora NRRL Y-12698]ODQ77679.1 hypothetical protein BABINDRAFT_163391 [Babjeviella inositovora NRRL Y-12698]
MLKQYGKRRNTRQYDLDDLWDTFKEHEISDTSFAQNSDDEEPSPGISYGIQPPVFAAFNDSPLARDADIVSLELVPLEVPRVRAREPLALLSPNVHRMVHLEQDKPNPHVHTRTTTAYRISAPMNPRKEVIDATGRSSSVPMTTHSIQTAPDRELRAASNPTHRRSISTSILESDAIAKGKKLLRRMSQSFRGPVVTEARQRSPTRNPPRSSISLFEKKPKYQFPGISQPVLHQSSQKKIENKFGSSVISLNEGVIARETRSRNVSNSSTGTTRTTTNGSGSDKTKPVAVSSAPAVRSFVSSRARSSSATADHHLHPLLALTSSPHVTPFLSFINSRLPRFQLSKLAESTYSEVFLEASFSGDARHVLKIVPFAAHAAVCTQDLVQELQITQHLSHLDGFVKYTSSHVVQGSYPELLLRLWDRYGRSNSSENARPDGFSATQMFLVIELEYAGTDLERFPVQDWQQASRIFWLVARTLALGEVEHKFEHRDLHWGNITIKEHVNYQKLAEMDVAMGEDPTATELEVTVIDFTLSKLKLDTQVVWKPLDDPELFTGKGDYQFEIYRFMKADYLQRARRNGVDWSVDLKSNVYWLHYLADKLLNHKLLVAIARDGNGPANPHHAVDVARETRCYEALKMCHRILDPRGARHARNVSCDSFAGAGAFVAWARGMGVVDV